MTVSSASADYGSAPDEMKEYARVLGFTTALDSHCAALHSFGPVFVPLALWYKKATSPVLLACTVVITVSRNPASKCVKLC